MLESSLSLLARTQHNCPLSTSFSLVRGAHFNLKEAESLLVYYHCTRGSGFPYHYC